MAHRRAVRSSNRNFSWFDIKPSNVAVTVTGGTLLASLEVEELARRPFTVMRTHLMYYVESDQATISENYLGAVGMAVASEQAVAAGIGSIPTPAKDAASDLWFIHEWFTGSIIVGDATGFTEPSGQIQRLSSKAMRKVNDGEDLFLAVELDLLSGFLFTVAGRLLVKNS